MKYSLAENVMQFKVKTKIKGIRTGHVVDVVEKSSKVLVDFPGNVNGHLAAKFTHALYSQLQSRSIENLPVLLVFENDDATMPIIIDLLYSEIDQAESQIHVLEADSVDDVEVDGKRLLFNAENEIVLNCGKSSITLTRAGKIILRGTYLLNRSSGVNMIKGASIKIN